MAVTETEKTADSFRKGCKKKKSDKKGLFINFQKTDCMVVNKKDSARCALRIGDAKIMQDQHM